jgi:hypothetical protein
MNHDLPPPNSEASRQTARWGSRWWHLPLALLMALLLAFLIMFGLWAIALSQFPAISPGN